MDEGRVAPADGKRMGDTNGLGERLAQEGQLGPKIALTDI